MRSKYALKCLVSVQEAEAKLSHVRHGGKSAQFGEKRVPSKHFLNCFAVSSPARRFDTLTGMYRGLTAGQYWALRMISLKNEDGGTVTWFHV